MFCPDCGMDNQRGQKFCTRCGTNLMAIDRARDILNEVSSGAAANQLDSSTILKIMALVSIFGFLFTTGGTIALMAFDNGRTPIPLFFGFAGFASIVLICRYLFHLLGAPSKSDSKRLSSSYAPPAMSGTTNRRLAEGAGPYHSITEPTTEQFDPQRRANR
jgi:hypothetical protein